MTIASATQASGVTTCSQANKRDELAEPGGEPDGKTRPPRLPLDGDQNRRRGWHRDRPPGQWCERRVERQTPGEREADGAPSGRAGRCAAPTDRGAPTAPSARPIASVVGKPGHLADPPLHSTPRASCGHESSVAVCAPYNAARRHAVRRASRDAVRSQPDVSWGQRAGRGRPAAGCRARAGRPSDRSRSRRLRDNYRCLLGARTLPGVAPPTGAKRLLRLPDTPGPGTWATCAVPARPPNDPG